MLTVPGCGTDSRTGAAIDLGGLCEVDHFLQALSFAQEKMSCSLPTSPSNSHSAIKEKATSGDLSESGHGREGDSGGSLRSETQPLLQWSTRDWILSLLLSAVAGALMGAAFVIFWNKHSRAEYSALVDTPSPPSPPSPSLSLGLRVDGDGEVVGRGSGETGTLSGRGKVLAVRGSDKRASAMIMQEGEDVELISRNG